MQLPPLKCNLSQKFHTKGKWTTKNAKNVYFSSFAILKSATYKVLSRNEPWIYLTSLNWKFFFWSSLETVPLHLIHLPLLVEAWFQGSAERKTSYLVILFVLIFSTLISPSNCASKYLVFYHFRLEHRSSRVTSDRGISSVWQGQESRVTRFSDQFWESLYKIWWQIYKSGHSIGQEQRLG